MRVAGHLPQRPHLDPGLVHVDREPGDALVLRDVGIGAGDEHAEVGVLAARRPDLLAVDDPLVAVRHGPRREPGEVGAGARLAEQLAPRLGAGDDVADVQVDLLLRAVRGDGGRGQQQPEARGRAERAEVADLLLHPHGVVARQPRP